MKRSFFIACVLFLVMDTALQAQSDGALTLSYGNGVSRIVISPEGYRLGSDAELIPYSGAYALTGSAGGDALEIYNGSGVEQTFDITFSDLTIQTGEWEGAVAIKSQKETDTIVVNLYSMGTSLVCSGNHTALASRENTDALRIINLSVLNGTLTLKNQHEADGGFAWSSDYNTTFNLINTITIDGEQDFTNSRLGSVTLKPGFQYISNNDGTHQKTVNGNSVTEDCSYEYKPVEGTEQHRQVCIKCGHQKEPEPCTPSDDWTVKKEQYHAKTCSLCGQIISQELHSDNDNNIKCDVCDIIVLSKPKQVENVYQISNIAELYWYAALVNGTLEMEPQNKFATAVLTADIVINENVISTDGQLVEKTDDLIEWTPIGSESMPFEGTFNGLGHTISGLYINKPTAEEQGLFGFIGFDGKVSRTEVTDSYIHGKHSIGGITGYNNGTITACSYSGTVIGYAWMLGGIAGQNDGMVNYCYTKGKVHATDSDPYVGGVVGDNYGFVYSCYSTAVLSSEYSGYIGGVVSYNDNGIITDCYYLQGTAEEGIGINSGTSENVESRTAKQFADGEVTWLLNMQAKENPVWFQTLGTDALPVLDNTHGTIYATGNCPGDITAYTNQSPSQIGKHADKDNNCKCDYCGTIIPLEPDMIEDVYQISNINELYWFAALVNGTLETKQQDETATAVLTTDIIINENVLTPDGKLVEETDALLEWTPIGKILMPFNGTFDGQGHSIKGLYINQPTSNNHGLFSYLGENAIIKNTGLLDGYIHSNEYTAGIAAHSIGLIENCYNNIKIVGNNGYAAGICSENLGKIVNSYNNGVILGLGSDAGNIGGIASISKDSILFCYNTGSVIGSDDEIGGIVGDNNGVIEYCYNTGHVKGNEEVGGIAGDNGLAIKYCYNKGNVKGYKEVGGIAGYNSINSNIYNCFNIGNVTGEYEVGGILGDKNDNIHSSYYLYGTAPGGNDSKDKPGMAESRTAEQFTNGEVTWLLQSTITGDSLIWGQNLTTDTLPMLLSEHKVYAAFFIHKTTDLQLMGKYINQNAQISLPTAEELGVKGEVSFTDKSGNPVTEDIIIQKDTTVFVNCDLYSITINDNMQNGRFIASHEYCNAGAKVAVKAMPQTGYEPFNLWVKTSDGQDFKYDEFTSDRPSDITFTMPASDVVLSVDFIPYLYGETYNISEDINGYNVELIWDYDILEYRTQIYRDGKLIHTTMSGETSWLDKISEEGIYNYTLYVIDEQDTRSRGTSLTVYIYPETRMETSGTQNIDLGDSPKIVTDDGGRSLEYSNNVDASMVITAQEDCRIYLVGNYEIEKDFDYLFIYDSDNSLLGKYTNYGKIEPALISSGNELTINFTSDDIENYKGFDLYMETVYPISIAEMEYGTIIADTAWAKANETVILTPLPDEYGDYIEGSLKVLKADDPTVEVPVNADGSFTMPAFKIIVTAAFESTTDLTTPKNDMLQVFGSKGTLQIIGTTAEVNVYDMSGMLVYDGKARTICLPAGIYIVHAAGQVQKAVVK